MKRLSLTHSKLTKRQYLKLSRLSTPIKIQDYLDTLPMNWEKDGDTHMSPRRVLLKRRAHCIEGALFAAAALWIAGEKPLIMNISPKMNRGDDDHVVALYKREGRWGAISKTNHATIRFRDPVYRTLRELVLSYFHEWFLNANGRKILECYSQPLDMRRFGTSWITAENDLWNVAEALSNARHYFLVPKKSWEFVRKADKMEMKAGKLIEWKRSDKRI